ncbi:MAG: alanine racemase [Actinomycetota bacterium]|nr:alanine racemase [Actinomycetota bacterium]
MNLSGDERALAEKRFWRPTYAEVDLDNIRHNVRLFAELVGDGCQIMAVVKADGYGHGDVETAGAALQAGATRLGVALVEEGDRLRGAGFKIPIHLLFEPPVSAAGRVVELALNPTVYTMEFAEALSRAAVEKDVGISVHAKVDTGMHRVGMNPDRAASMLEEIALLPGLKLEGIYTHMAMASELDHPFSLRQWRVFERVLEEMETRGIEVPIRHSAASGAALSLPDARMDMIRLGIAMYGLLPGGSYTGMLDLRPALSLRTRISQVFRVPAGEGLSYGLTHVFDEPSWVAVLPLGYADGLSRDLSNRWEVLIAGKAYAQVGMICMDICMVKLGEDRYTAGEEVTVIGGYGEEEIGIERVAGVLGTINYEIVCGIGKRVPRVYRNVR